MIFTNVYPIVIQNGDNVVYEFSVSNVQGKQVYAIKSNYGSFRVISEAKFNAIMNEARSKGYYIFNYGEFD